MDNNKQVGESEEPGNKPSAPAPQDEVEALSKEFHAIYQAEAKRQGDVRYHDDYEALSENVKEFDRVLARAVIRKLQAAREEKNREMLNVVSIATETTRAAERQRILTLMLSISSTSDSPVIQQVIELICKK